MAGEQHKPTSTELAAASAEWEHRYRTRPETQAQRNALGLLSSGQVRRTDPDGAPGLDGAWYAAAAARLYGSTFDDPAVVVTTRTAAVEIVTGFASQAARDAWLTDRAHGKSGPLASVTGGPPSRAAREEAALAWLLDTEGPPGEMPLWLQAQLFTTYSRSEIFLAWREASPGATVADVASGLDRRLLRAPDWAAGDIGRLGERTVPAYLRRIAATPVTEDQAAAAFHDLVLEYATLAPLRATAAVAPPRPAPESVPLIPRPRPAPGQGPAPRP